MNLFEAICMHSGQEITKNSCAITFGNYEYAFKGF